MWEVHQHTGVFKKSAGADLLTALCSSHHLLTATYHIKDGRSAQTHRSISLIVITSIIQKNPFQARWETMSFIKKKEQKCFSLPELPHPIIPINIRNQPS